MGKCFSLGHLPCKYFSNTRILIAYSCILAVGCYLHPFTRILAVGCLHWGTYRSVSVHVHVCSCSAFKSTFRNVTVQVQVWKCQCVSVSVEVSLFKRFSGRVEELKHVSCWRDSGSTSIFPLWTAQPSSCKTRERVRS